MKALLSTLMLVVLASLSTVSLANADKDRAKVDEMVSETLADFRKEKPDIDSEIKGAHGYAVFSNIGVNLFVISAGGGSGQAIDNANGKKTYMKMGEAGVGLGAGVKDFRAVMIFNTRESFDKFVESGWLFGAQADAAATASDKGGSAEVEGAIGDVTIYQMTEAGLSLEATVKGTKYWKNDKLN